MMVVGEWPSARRALHQPTKGVHSLQATTNTHMHATLNALHQTPWKSSECKSYPLQVNLSRIEYMVGLMFGRWGGEGEVVRAGQSLTT